MKIELPIEMLENCRVATRKRKPLENQTEKIPAIQFEFLAATIPIQFEFSFVQENAYMECPKCKRKTRFRNAFGGKSYSTEFCDCSEQRIYHTQLLSA